MKISKTSSIRRSINRRIKRSIKSSIKRRIKAPDYTCVQLARTQEAVTQAGAPS